MHEIVQKYKNWFTKSHHSHKLFVIFALVVVGVFLLAQPVAAGVVEDFFAAGLQGLINSIVDLYLYFVGGLLTGVLIPVLVGIAQYNSFIDNPIVSTGWSLVRDLANVFFIVVLLLIAFSTMLRIQTYHYKQALAKLIMMIILINFSKVISGVIIDFFQVLMLTFVNGFRTAMGGNFISAFHIYEMLAFAQTSAAVTTSSSEWTITGSLILAAVGITVVTMTILIMIVVLLYRMVMLWILVILSPLAYFAYTVRPQYWSQWWSEFFKHLISGPTIAFFLWLALLTAQGTTDLIPQDKLGSNQKGIDIDQSKEGNFASGFAVPSVMLNFMAMTALMIGGLIVSQKMAEQSGSAVGNIAGKIRKSGMTALKYGTGAFIAKKGYDWGARRVKAYKGMKENIKNKRAGEFAQGIINMEGKAKAATIGKAGKGLKKVYDTATGKNWRERAEKNLSTKKQELAELEGQDPGEDEDRVKHFVKVKNARDAVTDAEKNATRAKWANRIGYTVIGGGGALLGAAATGGLGAVAGVVGAGVGALAHKGASTGLQKLSESGQDEQKAAKYMQSEKINNYRKDFTDKGKSDLVAAISEASKSDEEKMAAMIELVSRGDANDGDISGYRDFMKRNGDKYVQGTFENEVDKKNSTMSINRDGLTITERVRISKDKIEDFNASALKTNMGDILAGHLEEVERPDGTTKKIFNNKKFASGFNRMSLEKQQAAAGSLAKIANMKASDDGYDKDMSDAAENVLIGQNRFDKLDVKNLDANKIAGHIMKNKKQFVANVIDNPDGLSPEVIVKMQQKLPSAQFQKIWEDIKNVSTGDNDDATIESSTLSHLVGKASKKEKDTGKSLDPMNAGDKELIKQISDFTALSGNVDKVLDSDMKDSTKDEILEMTTKSPKLRVQELSKVDFRNLKKLKYDKVGGKVKNNILKNKKSFDIESAFNKQHLDKGNTDKMMPLIDYMKEILDQTLAGDKLTAESEGMDAKEATEIQKNVFDSVYKFINSPNSMVGKEFIDYDVKDLKNKRDELLGRKRNTDNDATESKVDNKSAEDGGVITQPTADEVNKYSRKYK